jgi:RNA polymerase sigma-70 factor (ECF subfamily)
MADAQPDDAILLARIAAGKDPGAMELLYTRWFPQFVALARFLTRNSANSEDIAQDRILRVFAGAASFRPAKSSARAWLLRVLHNAAVSQVRYDEVRQAVSLTAPNEESQAIDVPAEEPSPADRALAREHRDAIRAAVDKLPDELRDVLVLCDLDELRATDAAEILDLPVTTVRSRLYQARQQFEAILRTDCPEMFEN